MPNIVYIIFSSEDCEKCQSFIPVFENLEILYKNKATFCYVDVEDQTNSFFCDFHEVDELPHSKIYLGEDCLYEKIGIPDIRVIQEVLDNAIKRVSKESSRV